MRLSDGLHIIKHPAKPLHAQLIFSIFYKIVRRSDIVTLMTGANCLNEEGIVTVKLLMPKHVQGFSSTL
jgi:hypothetical protein